MPTNLQTIRHDFGGGWGPDFAASVTVSPQGGVLRIPHLVEADNCFFELGGGPHKVGGCDKLFDTALESGAAIRGLFDYWRMGTGGSSVQKRVLHVGTTIKNDNADGTFVDLFTGLSATSIPNYAVTGDALVIAQTGADVPRWWDQGTAQNLAGSPPNFSVVVFHKNRAWAIGVDANPSRLYYSVLGDEEDWIGAGSGTIDIDPDDGDRNTGLASHKNELWIFKGPNAGSIHRITGSAPTGDDGFGRLNFVSGLGAVNQNGIFRFRDDIGFIAPQGSVHSLAATAAFGDFLISSLSFPLNNWLRDHVRNSALDQSWAAVDEVAGCVRISLPINGSATPNFMLCMDFRRSTVQGAPEIWWSPQPAFDWPCVARVLDPTDSNRPILMAGGDDGFVRRMDRSNRVIDGTDAIAYKVFTPHLSYGSGLHKKALYTLGVGIAPKGNFDLILGWQRDQRPAQQETISQGGGGDTLARLTPTATNEFTLGTSELAGARFSDRFVETEDGGEFSSIQYRVQQSGVDEDAEVHNITALVEKGAIRVEEI